MSLPKKGQRNQFVFPMIEADGLSVASTLTASQLRSGGSRKYWGYDHNAATLATSGTPSQTASLLRSGLFQIKMNAAECVYDRMNILFGHPTCLDQDLVVDFADYDDSDIMSMLIGNSAGISNIQSELLALSAQLSDVYSAVQAVGSTSDVRSRLSDIQSYLAGISAQLSNFQSQFDSRVTGVVMTSTEMKSAVGSVMSSPLSDIHSGVTAGRSVASDTYSLVLALSAQISDIYSAVVGGGGNSDLRSRLSDIQSYLAGISAMLSDVHSGVTAGRSVASDTYSLLLAVSGQISDIYSGIGDISVALTASQISNLASQVAAEVGFTPQEIASAVSTALAPGFDDISAVLSDMKSYLIGLSGNISDVYSAVQAGAGSSDLRSRLSDIQSMLAGLSQQSSDIYSNLTENRGEPGQGAPPVSTDTDTKIDYIYKAWRNRTTQDATSYRLFNDNTLTIGQSALVDDNGNRFERGEVGSGA